MSHEIEQLADGTYGMVYAGAEPWHKLGKRVLPDLTPDQMLKEAGLDWTVELRQGFTENSDGVRTAMRHGALVRSTDDKVLTEVPMDWKPVQNHDAFTFFNDFVAAGDMEMHTAGSLHGGQYVWCLARVKESFEVVKGKGDEVDSYLLFTNPHKYGFSTDVRFTPIRVVCWNTLSLSLSARGSADRVVTVSHRKKFVADEVKETLGVAKEKLAKYKEYAQYLASKRHKDEDVVTYFKRVFPLVSSKDTPRQDLTKAAATAISVLETQPGAAPGTFWNLFNAATYYTDHLAGRTDDTRITSAWYGSARKLKVQALETAVEMASAA